MTWPLTFLVAPAAVCGSPDVRGTCQAQDNTAVGRWEPPVWIRLAPGSARAGNTTGRRGRWPLAGGQKLCPPQTNNNRLHPQGTGSRVSRRQGSELSGTALVPKPSGNHGCLESGFWDRTLDSWV